MARKQSGGLNKLLNFIGLVDDEDTQDTYGEEYSSDNYGRRAAYTPARQQRGNSRPAASRQPEQRRLPESSSRSGRYESRYGNVPQRVSPQRSMRVSQRSKTVMYSLHSLEDCCEVIDQLIANNTVVLTMDELDGSLLQRAVDTLSGAVFALHASIRKASDRTYLIAPNSVVVDEAYDLDRRY